MGIACSMTFIIAVPINPYCRCLYYPRIHIHAHGRGHNTSAHNWERTPLPLLRLHRIIRQGSSARDFVPVQSFKNEGILYVFPVFWNCRNGAKDPLRSADAIVRCCLKLSVVRQCGDQQHEAGAWFMYQGTADRIQNR